MCTMTKRINVSISDELYVQIYEYNKANPEATLNLSVIFQNAIRRKLNLE